MPLDAFKCLTKSLKIILRVVNVLSRNPEGMLSVGDIYPGPGGRGGCLLFFVSTIEKVYFMCSRPFGEG